MGVNEGESRWTTVALEYESPEKRTVCASQDVGLRMNELPPATPLSVRSIELM